VGTWDDDNFNVFIPCRLICMSKTYYPEGNFKWEVVITDRRTKYFGRPEALIVPVAGSGEKWVYESKLLKSVPNLEKKIVKIK